jgi:biotin synthase-related radical SAM superfamily protein
MSDFAFFRFNSYSWLTEEEKLRKAEIIEITEEVLDSKGIECDARISKLSQEQLKEILDEVREKIKKKKKKNDIIIIESESEIFVNNEGIQ